MIVMMVPSVLRTVYTVSPDELEPDLELPVNAPEEVGELERANDGAVAAACCGDKLVKQSNDGVAASRDALQYTRRRISKRTPRMPKYLDDFHL